MDITAVARYARVAPRTVTKWIDAGRLPATKNGEKHDVSVKDTIAFFYQHGLPVPEELMEEERAEHNSLERRTFAHLPVDYLSQVLIEILTKDATHQFKCVFTRSGGRELPFGTKPDLPDEHLVIEVRILPRSDWEKMSDVWDSTYVNGQHCGNRIGGAQAIKSMVRDFYHNLNVDYFNYVAELERRCGVQQ